MKNVSASLLLVAACLLILSWLDHHAAEYDPRHTHIAPGLLGVALDLGVIPHEHAFSFDHGHHTDDHSHDTEPEPARSSNVQGEKVTQTASLRAAGRGTTVALLPAHNTVARQLRPIDKAAIQPSVWFAAIDLDLIDPPPRLL